MGQGDYEEGVKGALDKAAVFKIFSAVIRFELVLTPWAKNSTPRSLTWGPAAKLHYTETIFQL